MFEPEILGVSSSALWGIAQSLVTPTLAFVFLYLMRLPLKELPFIPKDTYVPPAWVLPIFAHGSMFAIVAIVATNVLLNRMVQAPLADAISPELYLARDLDMGGQRLAKVVIVLKSYDGLSNFRIFANGYHVLSSNRDCVAKFQCRPMTDVEAEKEAAAFRQARVSGGSQHDLSRTNKLPYEVYLNHYLAVGQNHIDLISENSGTGGCELSAALVLTTEKGEDRSYEIRISSLRNDRQPGRRGHLIADEVFYSGGPTDGDTIERYNTSAIERRNVVCERIRISIRLSELEARTLSSDTEFESYFKSIQKAYICETIGKPIPGCGGRP